MTVTRLLTAVQVGLWVGVVTAVSTQRLDTWWWAAILSAAFFVLLDLGFESGRSRA